MFKNTLSCHARMAVENATVNATVNVVDTFSEELHLGTKNVLLNSSVGSYIVAHPWLMCALIIICGYALSYVFVYLCKTCIKQFTQRTETELDDILLEQLQHPVALSLFILSITVALVPLSLSSHLAQVLNRVVFS